MCLPAWLVPRKATNASMNTHLSYSRNVPGVVCFIKELAVCNIKEKIKCHLYFKMPKCLSNDIIKTATKFIKATIKVKRIRNYVLKFHLHLYFIASQKLLISAEKKVISAEFKKCVTWCIYFKNLFKLRYIIAGYAWQILGMGLFCPPIHEQPRKCPSWIGLMLHSLWRVQFLMKMHCPGHEPLQRMDLIIGIF